MRPRFRVDVKKGTGKGEGGGGAGERKARRRNEESAKRRVMPRLPTSTGF